MKTNLWLLAAMLSSLMLASCGGYGNNTCTISAAITPATATADHTLAPPGNQAQFALTSSVKGNCPYIADLVGVWSSSEPPSTARVLQPAMQPLRRRSVIAAQFADTRSPRQRSPASKQGAHNRGRVLGNPPI